MPKRFLWVVLGCALAALPGTDVAEGQSWRTVNSSRRVSGEDDLSVRVKYGAGQFTVNPAAHGFLYEMTLTYDEDHFEPLSEYTSGRLTLGIEGTRKNIDIDGDNKSRLDLTLTRDVPMDLVLEFGAVKADFDLTGVALRNLSITTGASESEMVISEPNPVAMEELEIEVGAASFEARGLGNLNAKQIHLKAGVGNVELDFTGAWKRDGEISVNMGLGSLTLTLPREVGVRLIKDTFLTGLDAEGLEKRDGDYYSENWASAEIQLVIEVEAAFGNIEVKWAG